MEPSLREDLLEAICLLIRDSQRSPRVREIASALDKPEGEIQSGVTTLAADGDVILENDGTVTLTATGQELGNRVAKKHETLQCFLSEILGMDRSSASDEACVLEHAVSDDTINRIGTYMQSPPRRWRRGQGDAGQDASPLPALTDFNEGDELVVSGILGRERAWRLLDLGVVPGERVRIKRKLANHALVVQVKGCDVALSPEVAASICVERSG